MSHHPYPETLPTDCLTTVITLIRTRTVAENLPEFANCIWTMTGFGLKLGVGDPDDHPEVFGAADLPDLVDLEDCSKALESMDADAIAVFGAAEGEEAIDPATLMMLLQLAVKIFEFFKNRKRAGS